MRKFLGPAIVAGAALLGTALPTLADPNLPNVGAHRHFIQTPTGQLVEVGPRFCDDPSLQQAFNQFHFNVHHSFIRVRGVEVHVPSKGPQDGAPGLQRDWRGVGGEALQLPALVHGISRPSTVAPGAASFAPWLAPPGARRGLRGACDDARGT